MLTKRETWELIKQTDPEAAEFILAVSKVFGRLDDVEVIVSRETKEDNE